MKKENSKKISSACLAALLTASMLFASACSDNSEDTNAPWTTEAPETIPWTTDDIESNIVYEDTDTVEDVTDTFETNTPETDAPETLFGPGYELSDGTLTILDDDAMEDYVVSQEIPWYGQRESITKVIISDGVTRIASLAFSQCSNLESITIPDSVKSIGECAFIFSGISSITIPASVTYIELSAFMDCENFTSITVDEKNVNYSSIDGVLFSKDKTELLLYPINIEKASYTVPNGVTKIGDGAFRSCETLTSVVIPDGVTDIGAGAFDYCIKLESVTLPDSVRNIETEAFRSCEALGSIKIPNGVEKINIGTFMSCTSLSSVEIPQSVKIIDGSSFMYCESLTEVVIPNSVEAIGMGAFAFCGLKSVTLPDSVKAINEGVFDSCENLISFTITANLIKLDCQFCGCTSLTEITVDKNNKYFSSDEHGVLFNKDKTTLYVYPANKKNVEYTIPDSVTAIGKNAFSYCTNLESITIPDSVESIDMEVFYSCSSLKTINFSGSEEQWNAIEKNEWNVGMPECTINFGA